MKRGPGYFTKLIFIKKTVFGAENGIFKT